MTKDETEALKARVLALEQFLLDLMDHFELGDHSPVSNSDLADAFLRLPYFNTERVERVNGSWVVLDIEPLPAAPKHDGDLK